MYPADCESISLYITSPFVVKINAFFLFLFFVSFYSISSPPYISDFTLLVSNFLIFFIYVCLGANDTFICSTPNDYILYFGTLRRVFAGDIVVAIEAGMSEEIKGSLSLNSRIYNVISFLLFIHYSAPHLSFF